jgi:hypothetical protein
MNSLIALTGIAHDSSARASVNWDIIRSASHSRRLAPVVHHVMVSICSILVIDMFYTDSVLSDYLVLVVIIIHIRSLTVILHFTWVSSYAISYTFDDDDTNVIRDRDCNKWLSYIRYSITVDYHCERTELLQQHSFFTRRRKLMTCCLICLKQPASCLNEW